jgi:hypothetical protein
LLGIRCFILTSPDLSSKTGCPAQPATRNTIIANTIFHIIFSPICRDGEVTRLNAMETRRLWLADTESLAPLIDATGAPPILPPDDVLKAQADMLAA